MNTQLTARNGKRKILALPSFLYEQISEIAKKEKLKLSQIVHAALKDFIEKKEKERITQ